MKSLITYITENYKLPVIQTMFGTSSPADKKAKEKETSKKVEINFDPIMNNSVVKEETEHDKVIQPHTDAESKKFHSNNRMKDEMLSSAPGHQGWLHNYSDNSKQMNDALYNHHQNKKIETTQFNDEQRHQRNLSFANETEKVLAKHKTNDDHTVFTGISQEHAGFLKNQTKPTKVHHAGFISSSTHFDQAARFTGGGGKNDKEEKHILQIHVPKGTQGGSMSGNTYYSKEKEILLQRGHDLKIDHTPTVINHPKHGTVNVWHAKIIGHNPKPLNSKPVNDVLYPHEKT
jgi:hypothetical protein